MQNKLAQLSVRRNRPLPCTDDGDEVRFCTSCAFSTACLSQGHDKTSLRELQVAIEHIGPFEPGTYLFREGDPFTAIGAVRSGTVKTSVVGSQGKEQVLGFYFPGEFIGLGAIHRDRYPCDAIAVDEVMLCRFSFPKIALLATRMPALQQHLFRLLSEDIGRAALLAGDFTAEERVAAFLVSLARRAGQRTGVALANRLSLPMPRTDIANHLRLAPETVSRVLRRMQDAGLVRVVRRELEILDPAQLKELAEPVLRG